MESLRNNLSKLNSKIAYGSGIILATLIAGSAYYLFTLFQTKLNLSEELNIQLEEIKEELEENQGELTVEISLQIVGLISKFSDEIFDNNYSKINEKRRETINNPDLYFKNFKETILIKEKCLKEAKVKVFSQFGNISDETAQKIISKISPFELESITEKHDSLLPEGNNPPEKNFVKEAYKYYSERLLYQIEHFHITGGKYFSDTLKEKNENDDILFLKLLLIKVKSDDELYLKYNLTEHQVRYLLKEYQMSEDSEIMIISQSIASAIALINKTNF